MSELDKKLQEYHEAVTDAVEKGSGMQTDQGDRDAEAEESSNEPTREDGGQGQEGGAPEEGAKQPQQDS